MRPIPYPYQAWLDDQAWSEKMTKLKHSLVLEGEIVALTLSRCVTYTDGLFVKR